MDKSLESEIKESDRKEYVKESQVSLNMNEKVENVKKGLDYFYYKVKHR